jgi:hypothetical protein
MRALSRNEKHQFDTPQRGIAAALSLVLMIVFDTTTLLASHEVGVGSLLVQRMTSQSHCSWPIRKSSCEATDRLSDTSQ